MSDREPKRPYWFKRRRFGWGWIPVAWQGWAVVLTYAVIVLGVPAAFSDSPDETWLVVLTVVVATGVLVMLGFRHGPAPRWRWGRRPEDDPAEDW